MEKNGTFYFTNGYAKVTTSSNPIHVHTHDWIGFFLGQEKDTIVANFHVHGNLSPRNKEILEQVLREQKRIDLYY